MSTRTGWTEEEITVFQRRMGALIAYGIDDLEAEAVCESMVNRDHEGGWSGMRICFECQRFSQSRRACERGIQVPRATLQRCDSFRMRGASRKNTEAAQC